MDDRMLENLLCAADQAAGPPLIRADLASAARRSDAQRQARRARLSRAVLVAAAYVAGLLTMHFCIGMASRDQQPALSEAAAPQPSALVEQQREVQWPAAPATTSRDFAGDGPEETTVYQQLRELGNRHLGHHSIKEAIEYYRLALDLAAPEELAAVSHDTWLLAALKKDRKEISYEIPDIERDASDMGDGSNSRG